MTKLKELGLVNEVATGRYEPLTHVIDAFMPLPEIHRTIVTYDVTGGTT